MTDHDSTVRDDAPMDPSQPLRQILLRPRGAGRLEADYSGDRSTGENNRDEVATAVVHFLKEWGEEWGAPLPSNPSDQSADMIAYGPTGTLRMQIVQVPCEPEYWAQVAVLGRASKQANSSGAAEDLIHAIRIKRDHYSAPDRASLVLVLDASRSVIYDLPPTLHAFRELFLEEAKSSGFEDIFVLGFVRFINLMDPPEGSEWFSVA